MSASAGFAAKILEAGAGGYAGFAASLLLERHPAIAQRYEPNAFADWKEQIRRWLLDLAAAVGAGEPSLFESRMLWNRKAFVAREVPVNDLKMALMAVRGTLAERLPSGAGEVALETLDRGLAVLDAVEEGDGDELQIGRPALDYVKTILEGNPRAAIERMLKAVDGDISVKQVYLDVLIPAQREVGRMWHAGELSIAEEHLVTMTTQRLMALLCERARPASLNGKAVVLACVEGNAHDIGIRAIADFLEMAGWRAINLGPSVPSAEIAKAVQCFEADVVILTTALETQLEPTRTAIAAIRAVEGREAKIIVGGPLFEQAPELWRKLGADGHAAKLEDVEPLAAELTDGDR